MAKLLKERWFLICLVAGVVISLATPGIVIPATEPLPARWVVTSALFLMAWTMPSRSLGDELRNPWAALWAMGISYGALPAIAWAVGGLSPTPDLRVGLMLAASVPCTLASCVLWTRLAGGNEATALLAVMGCTMMSWLLTPLWLAAATAAVVTLDRTQMMVDLAWALVAPVALGQALRLSPIARHLANARKTALSALAQMFVLAIVLRTASQVGLRLQEGAATLTAGNLALSASLAMGVHIVALYLGYFSAPFDRPRRIAIAFSGSQKTLPISTLLFETTFQHDFPLAIIPLLFFHVGQLLFDTVVAERWKRRNPPTESVSFAERTD